MKRQTLRHRILVADLAWVVVAMGLAYLLRYQPALKDLTRNGFFVFVPPLLFTLLLWSIVFSWLRLDGFTGGWRFPAVLSQLFPAVTGVMAALFASAYLARWYMSRLALGYFGALLFLGLGAIRFISRSLLASRYRSGAVRRVVVIGSGALAREMVTTIERHPELLCQVVGFLCPAEDVVDTSLSGIGSNTVSLQTLGIVDLLRSLRVDEIILTVPKPGHPEILEVATRCRRAGLTVSLVPQPYELYLSKPELIDLDGIPLLQLEGASPEQGNSSWKRILDVALAICLLPFAMPALFLAAAVLKFRKGKGFCRELRCGQNGRTFWMYRLNSERHGNRLPTSEFLMQQSSLTELPQLFNVLRGEMSIVGPRPEGPERIRHYSDWLQRRLNVKPGMTGLAQVHGLRDQNSSEDKARYDLQYILRQSVFQDISLLLQTVSTLALRALRLRRFNVASPHVSADTPVETGSEEDLSCAHRAQSGTD